MLRSQNELHCLLASSSICAIPCVSKHLSLDLCHPSSLTGPLNPGHRVPQLVPSGPTPDLWAYLTLFPLSLSFTQGPGHVIVTVSQNAALLPQGSRWSFSSEMLSCQYCSPFFKVETVLTFPVIFSFSS